MRRAGHLFEMVADFHALCAAARRAARGKGKSQNAAGFLFSLETEVLKLQREILDGSYRPRPYRTFSISDPKPRTISAADFRDRVAHHALCSVLEPLFERAAIFDSYACRMGKGSHAAVKRARSFCRRFRYFLKLDVRRFFETADHGVLKASLRRLVKDDRLLRLAGRIIDHGAPGSASGKGLPIGNLTSQHFANHYLTALDHFIKEKLRVLGYLRYMDDQLLFGDSKDFLRDARRRIAEFLARELKLELKDEACVLAPVSEGVPFLGLRLWPAVVRLDGPGKRRLVRALRLGAKALMRGRMGEEELAPSMMSRLGHAAHADTHGLRRSLWGLMTEAFAVEREGMLEASSRNHGFGLGGATGSNRVKRGGSWNNNAGNLRAANRNNDDPGNRNNNLGLRPASSRRPSATRKVLCGQMHGVYGRQARAQVMTKPP